MSVKVTVITPVYNREKELPRAIESILSQTFSDFEYILIDDGSTDSTPEIIRYYADKDSRIRVVATKGNSRMAKVQWEPRNIGLALARGEFISYLDSDNEWLPSFLEEMSTILINNPDDVLVHCDSLNFYPKGEIKKVLESDYRTLVFLGTDCACFSYNKLDPAEFGKSIYIDTNEMMHRRSVFKHIGGYWKIAHPKREQIQMYQGNKFLYRRHNDLELFERIFYTFGENAIYHLKKILVKYYYPCAWSGHMYKAEDIEHINLNISY